MHTMPVKDFITAWQLSASVSEVAKKVGASASACTHRASALRKLGIPLKRMHKINVSVLADYARSLLTDQSPTVRTKRSYLEQLECANIRLDAIIEVLKEHGAMRPRDLLYEVRKRLGKSIPPFAINNTLRGKPHLFQNVSWGLWRLKDLDGKGPMSIERNIERLAKRTRASLEWPQDERRDAIVAVLTKGPMHYAELVDAVARHLGKPIPPQLVANTLRTEVLFERETYGVWRLKKSENETRAS